jgi:hypothetical protein
MTGPREAAADIHNIAEITMSQSDECTHRALVAKFPDRALARALLLALSLGATCAHADEPFERPAVIRFGASIAEVERALEGKCTEQQLRTDDPIFLPNVRERQSQIDCGGFQFLGQGRHVEFVFRDGRLMMVWLMVTDAETQTMIDAMTRAYGAPTARNADYVTFERNRAAWRYRPAEILFWAEELDSDIACIYPAVSPGRCARTRN